MTTSTLTTLRTAVAAPQRVADRVRTVPHRRYLTLLVLATAVVHACLGIQQFNQYRLGGYDLSIFDQAVRSYAHFHLPSSPFEYVHYGLPANSLVLGDHFSPIIALAAPFYWVWNDPRTLLLVEAAVVALAVPPVWLFVRRALGVRCAYLVTVAFAISWPLQQLSSVGFHEAAFAVPIIAVALERAQARRYGQAALVICLLLLVKEDMGLMVAAFGLALFLRDRRRRLGTMLMVGGVTAMAITLTFVIPYFGGNSGYYWNYDELGSNVPQAGWYVLTHPLHTLHLAVGVDAKWQLLLFLVLPLGALCLFSPFILMALPPLAERLLSTNPNLWTTGQHYNAFLVPVVTLAAVDGAVRVLPKVARRCPRLAALACRARARLVPDYSVRWALDGRPLGGRPPRVRPELALAEGWALGVAVTALVLCAFFPIHRLFVPHNWEQNGVDRAQAGAVAMIPDGAAVEADDYIATHLSRRTNVLLLDQTPRLQNWVIIRTNERVFPFTSLDQQTDRVAYLLGAGYEEVYDADGIVVLYHDGQAPPPAQVPQPPEALRPMGGE